jgi:DNA-binding Lrp family transcriptional regulator
MAVKGYVLITATAKEAKQILETLQASRIVQSAEAVTGPYDIIATVEAEDVDSLGRLITREIQHIPGVERTLTCLVMQI